jgi:hypothetical protein
MKWSRAFPYMLELWCWISQHFQRSYRVVSAICGENGTGEISDKDQSLMFTSIDAMSQTLLQWKDCVRKYVRLMEKRRY